VKVGDLVQIQKWCKGKGRIAHVVEEFWYDSRRVMVQFLDAPGLVERPIEALKVNLILVTDA
jgi:hypothetical protein